MKFDSLIYPLGISVCIGGASSAIYFIAHYLFLEWLADAQGAIGLVFISFATIALYFSLSVLSISVYQIYQLSSKA